MGLRRNSYLKTPAEIEKMRKAGKLLRSVFNELAAYVKPGVTTAALDKIAREVIEKGGAKPAFLGYKGFPATLCTSVNEEIVHGIPGPRILVDGDIVSIDCGLILDGFFSDSATTYPVGTVSSEAQKLIDVTKESLQQAINAMVVGARLGTVGYAVQKYVEDHGFSVVRDYSGHGIGRAMHEEPQIPNHGPADQGIRLKAGHVLAVEPMVNVGTWKTILLEDEWTVITADEKMSAHFEHTIAITDDGPDVLTL